jgi:hypothetical protein
VLIATDARGATAGAAPLRATWDARPWQLPPAQPAAARLACDLAVLDHFRRAPVVVGLMGALTLMVFAFVRPSESRR